MKKFSWKTVLNGFVCLLVLSSVSVKAEQTSVVSNDRDSFWASFDSTAPQPVAYSPQTGAQVAVSTTAVPQTSQVSMVAEPSAIIYEPATAVDTSREGLFLHRFNQSPYAYTGSQFLGAGSWYMDGYISQGLRYGNTHNLQPMGMNDREGYQMNQLYLSLGRKVIKGNQFSIGGQIDLMYGSDYYYMSAAGLETNHHNEPSWNSWGDDIRYRAKRSKYGWAMPQAFGEIYMPIMNGVDVKVGHFDSVMGYESLRANNNFFYSQTYSRLYGMPTSMTGVMGTLGLIGNWNLIMGGVNEWNAFDTPDDNFSGVVGLAYSDHNFFDFAATCMIGKQSAPCFQYETYSGDAETCVVFNTYGKFQLSSQWSYLIEFTFGYDERDYLVTPSRNPRSWTTNHGRSWYGLTNALFYKLNDQWTFGTRFEWFNDADSTIIDGGYDTAVQDGSANYFALTVGANWTPVSWISVRPELRYDFSDFDVTRDGKKLRTYDNCTSDNQFTVGADVIVRF